jgi:hypothetical protein
MRCKCKTLKTYKYWITFRNSEYRKNFQTMNQFIPKNFKKPKNICIEKHTTNKCKSHIINWEIIFATYITINKPVYNDHVKMTTWRGVIWPRGSLLPGGRGREQREPREGGREGQGLKYPSVGLSMI